MHYDCLIAGQGICGTLLSWFLKKEGKSFLVFDDAKPNSASRVAAGIINPVTGRRYTTTWMAEDIIPFAEDVYRNMGEFLQEDFISRKGMIDFFPSPQMRLAFIEKHSQDDTWLHSFPDQNRLSRYFNYDFGCGEIRPVFTVRLASLLDSWGKYLAGKGLLRPGRMEVGGIKIRDDRVEYKGITAERLIFCDGINSMSNPWFSLLPFSASKGEALVIRSPIPAGHLYKRSMILAPLEEDCFWVGSNFIWDFKDEEPTAAFRTQLTALLNDWLKQPFEIISHQSGIRPSTLERRPFVGFHPIHSQIGILNGMGTKGTSLAPFFANQLVQHMVYHLPLTPGADIRRFSRLLSTG